MDIKSFDLPTMDDGISVVEKTYCELLNMYHRGEKMDDVQKDWMDTANNWLMTSDGN